MRISRYILYGAGIGAMVQLAATLVMAFQPGIVDRETVSQRDIIVVNLLVGIPICTFGGGFLGWLCGRLIMKS